MRVPVADVVWRNALASFHLHFWSCLDETTLIWRKMRSLGGVNVGWRTYIGSKTRSSRDRPEPEQWRSSLYRKDLP